MAKMGRGSRSFLRYRENTMLLGDVSIMRSESKKEILEFMHRFEQNDRSVYFAENIQTLTSEEIKNMVKSLGLKLNEIGANGVIEAHPTADRTSKSAHIHYWGELNSKVESVIIDFIKKYRLSNKTYLNYTNEEMKQGSSHRVIKEGIVEHVFDREDVKNITRKDTKSEYDEEILALKNKVNKDTYYDDIIAYCDDMLDTLGDAPVEQLKKIDIDINMDEINKYIDDLEYDFYE